jgi:hypothetical protein
VASPVLGTIALSVRGLGIYLVGELAWGHPSVARVRSVRPELELLQSREWHPPVLRRDQSHTGGAFRSAQPAGRLGKSGPVESHSGAPEESDPPKGCRCHPSTGGGSVGVTLERPLLRLSLASTLVTSNVAE